jgi:hypothetical protein
MTTDARSAMLRVIEESTERPGDYPDQRLVYRTQVFERTAAKLGYEAMGFAPLHVHWAILDAWHGLYRSGLVTWGTTLIQNLPFEESAHLTEYGQKAIADVSRDPSNRAGYLAVLDSLIQRTAIAWAYAEEAVSSYNAGLNRATAVLIGAASESLVLELRDALVARRAKLQRSAIQKLVDWRIKTVLDAMNEEILRVAKATMTQDLRERFTSHWPALTGQIRRTRNEAGHPESVAPVTRDIVHAALLTFPEVARLAKDLGAWLESDYAG